MDFRHYPLSCMPDILLVDVCMLLDREGPCDYRSLIDILQRFVNLFSIEEYEQLKNEGAKTLLQNIASRDQTIGFLYECLSMLPCDCSTIALSKAVSKYHKEFHNGRHSSNGYNYSNGNSMVNTLNQMSYINPQIYSSGNYNSDQFGRQNFSISQSISGNRSHNQHNHLVDQQMYLSPNLQNFPQLSLSNSVGMNLNNSELMQRDNSHANNDIRSENDQGIDCRTFNNGHVIPETFTTHDNQNTSENLVGDQLNKLPSNTQSGNSPGLRSTDLTQPNTGIIDPNHASSQQNDLAETVRRFQDHSIASNIPRQLASPMSQTMGEIYITTQPKDCCLAEGDVLTLTCNAKMRNNSDVPLLFDWHANGEIVSEGCRNGKLMKEIGMQDRGIYTCRVTTDNRSNYVESNLVYVSVVPRELSASEFYATDKVALLIGNSNYLHNPNLPATVNDVKILAEILQNDLDFKVLSFTDLTFLEIHKALNLFKEFVVKGCYCVFYFAGHGFQNADKCYLVPVDAGRDFPINDGIDVKNELQIIQRGFSPNLMLILLDMCRNVNKKDKPNAYSSSFEDNVVICYSTNRNSAAYEVDSQGIFVKSLKKFLTNPIRVTHMLEETQEDVKKQHPSLQLCEIKSLLVENRSLRNHITPGPNYFKLTEDYRSFWVHHNVICTYQACEAYAKLIIQSVLSNVVEALVELVDPGKSKETCQVHIKTKDLVEKGLKVNVLNHLEGFGKDYSTHIEITNVQIMQNVEIPVRLLYKSNGKEYKKTQVFSVKLGMAQKWGKHFVHT